MAERAPFLLCPPVGRHAGGEGGREGGRGKREREGRGGGREREKQEKGKEREMERERQREKERREVSCLRSKGTPRPSWKLHPHDLIDT